jgi:hypothetical protein
MGCGCGAKAVKKEGSAKQVTRSGAGHPVSQKVVITAKKPVTRRVIKRPAR